MTQPTQIITSLEQQGLINQQDSTAAIALLGEKDTSTTPWFVQLLTGVGAWISAFIFFIAFIFSGIGGDFLDDEIVVSIFGAILLIAVFIIAAKAKKPIPIFLDQILLAMSLLGHVLFVIFFSFEQDNPEIWIAMMTTPLSLFIIFFYPNQVHKFLSTGALVAGLYLLVTEESSQPMILLALLFLVIAAAATWMWLNESYFLEGKKQAIARPVQYALMLMFIAGCSMFVEQFYAEMLYYQKAEKLPENVAMVANFSITPYLQFISVGLFLILTYVIVTILKRLSIEWKSLMGISLLIIALCLSILFNQSPSILSAIIILILGIERGNKLIVSIAIIALISFYSYYYHNLDMTLMTKSFILMAGGSVMLIGGWLASKIGDKS